MSLAVSRALSRASQNPDCELLAAMALEVGQRSGYGEPQFLPRRYGAAFSR